MMQWMGIGTILFGSIVSLIVLVDIVMNLKEWFGRIYIGRYQEVSRWEKAIIKRGIRWLNRTPTVRVTDHTRFVLFDMLQGNFKKTTIQQWQEASLVTAIHEYAQVSGDLYAQKQLARFVSSKLKADGNWIEPPPHVDGAILAYALLKFKRAEDGANIKPACDQMWQLIQTHIGREGTVMYRKSMPEYRYVDTIGFICPFLTAYGVMFDKPECIELAMKQITSYENVGMLSDRLLPCHAYHIEQRTPLGLYGWGRGIGWFAIGLIDTWRELPDEHPFKERMTKTIINLAHTIAQFQHEQGYWAWTVTRKESQADSSATAMLAWFMLQAKYIPECTDLCHKSALSATHYLMSVTRRNGAVDFSQGDTKDIGVYSGLFGVMPFTQGFCIRIAQHLNRDVNRHR